MPHTLQAAQTISGDVVPLTKQISSTNYNIYQFEAWLSNYRGQRKLSDKTKVLAAARDAGYNIMHPEQKAEFQNQRSQALAQLKETMAKSGLEGDIGIQSLVAQAMEGDAIAGQALQERLGMEQERLKGKQQLGQFRSDVEGQLFGGHDFTLEQALGSQTGELGQLSEALKKQQSGVFQQELRPLIEGRLGAKGLLESGANVELQSKALGGLERERQGMLSQAFFGGKEQLRGLDQRNLLTDIGARQQAMSQAFGLQRAGITMNFQRQLEAQRAQLARELAEISSGGGSNLAGILGLGLGAAGAGLGGMFGGLGGAGLGFGIGSTAGGVFGNLFGG